MQKRSSIVLSIRKEVKMNSRKFGETVEWDSIPVLNERVIKASAGMLSVVISKCEFLSTKKEKQL